MRICGLILAAGEGRRIGKPKAILEIGDRFLADIQYDLLSSCEVSESRIVIGAEAERVSKMLRHTDAIIINSEYKLGQFSSIVAGISALTSCDGILILPVDTYPLEKEVISALISGFDPAFDATVPIYQNRRGHPVIISSNLAQRLTSLDRSSSRLDEILRTSHLKLIPTSSPTILNNINYTTDLDRK